MLLLYVSDYAVDIYLYVDSSNNLKTAKPFLFFNKNTVLELKNI